MNLPLGTALKTGLDLSGVDLFALLKELRDKKFNGYVAIAVQGKYGIEEGTQLFDEGKPVASFYEYYRFNRSFLGKEAFVRVLNASASKSPGVIDVFELTNEQVHLVLAFNEAAIHVPDEAELRPRKLEYSPSFEEAVHSSVLPPSRQDLLKKYRVAGADWRGEEKEKPPELPKVEDLLEKLSKLKQEQRG